MTGKIFINYRRGDDPGSVGRLFDRLRGSFAADQLFMDVDSIAPGLDFVRVLEDQVDKCDLFLAVIGPRWLDARNEAGEPRLNDPNDFVRIEIETGLRLGKRIIPVLVNEAAMPRAEHLPEPLQPLVRRNAVRLTHERFDSDAHGLVTALQGVLDEAEQARKAETETERRAAEEAARKKQKEEEARAAEAERQAAERAREKRLEGWSPEAIQKADELANWEFIKGRGDQGELRDHIARYSGGTTERFARAELEELAKGMLGERPEVAAIDAFLDEFPTGRYAKELTERRDRLQAVAKAAKAQAAAREARRKARAEKRAQAWASLKKVFSSTSKSAASTSSSLEAGTPSLQHVIDEIQAEKAERPRAATEDAEVVAGAQAHKPSSKAHIAVALVYALAAYPAVLLSGVLFRSNSWSFLGSGADVEFQSGLIAGGLLVVGLGLLLARRRAQALTGNELALYWFGAALALTLLFAVIFATLDWDFFGHRGTSSTNPYEDSQVISGLLIWSLIVVSSAVFLVWRRRSILTGRELAIYWFGTALIVGLVLGAVLWALGGTLSYGWWVGALLAFVSGVILRLWWQRRKAAPALAPCGATVPSSAPRGDGAPPLSPLNHRKH